jgi:hypothetical protein
MSDDNEKVGYGRPPKAHRFKPGQVANPKGRAASAGTSIREWVNALAARELTELQVRRIARDKKAPLLKRAAAERMLRMVEAGDLADLEPYLDGSKTLAELRKAGINTEVVKKAKATRRTDEKGVEVETRELELHDRAGEEFDRICDRTDGRPTQRMEVEGAGLPTVVEIITPLTKGLVAKE